MKIDFITFITRYSSDYAEFLKYTCEKFLSGKHKISWKCIESVGAERLPQGYNCVAKTGEVGHNSMNHAVALNLAQKYIDHDYVVFIDADMAIVHKNWDDIIVNELNKYDCFGGSYEHGLKYNNFPTVYLIAFNSYILNKVKLDFSPKLREGKESPAKRIVNKKESKLFEMKTGSVIKCDTGWKLPLTIKGAGFSSNSMPMILMSSNKSQLPFENEKHKKICMKNPSHMCEWHYNNKLFATHKQASRNHPLDGKWGRAWKRRIELFTNKGTVI
jgi:glycosyltransferase involved in cell wall biosynthesis